MSKLQVPIHGRNHRRGGSDPIPITNRMPWLCLKQDLDGVTLVNLASQYFELGGQESLDGSGSLANTAASIDQSVFRGVKDDTSIVDIEGGNETYRGIQLPTPGLYYVRAVLHWYQDWGKCSVQYDISGTSGGFVNFQLRLDSTEGTWFLTGFPHVQVSLTADTLLAIDTATDVEVRIFGRNEGGADQTWDSSANFGEIVLDIVQLSTLGTSNPA